MYTYENARKPKKPAKKPRATKPAKTLTEKQHNAHARSRAAFQRARQIWSAVPGCDPYAALRQAWEEVKRGTIAPNYTKTVKPPKPKKPKKPKKNPQDMITVVVVDMKKGEIIRFKLPGDQYALMRDLEPGFDDETVRLWEAVRSRGVSGKVKFVNSDYPTSTLTFTVQNGSYRPTMNNPLLTSVQRNLLMQAANQETASAYESYEKAAVKELLKMGLIEIVSQQPRFIRFSITPAGHEALEHKAPPMTRRHSLADEVNAEYEQLQYPASVLRTARR